MKIRLFTTLLIAAATLSALSAEEFATSTIKFSDPTKPGTLKIRIGRGDLRITGTKLTLNGAGTHGPFITNPTDCRQATMTVSATGYDEPGTSTAAGSFTPTDCDKLPFTPKLSGTLGGQGTGLAVIGAYLLAGELARAGGDHQVAFAAYQARIGGYARACQQGARHVGPFHAPRTALTTWLRNKVYGALTSRALVGLFERLVKRAASDITLEEYA